MDSVVIAAGGTGGHLYPALAVAGELARLAPGLGLRFTGGAAGIEARVVPAEGWSFTPLESSAWHRGRPLTLLTGSVRALRGAWRARGFLRHEGARAVFSTGGFPAAPALLAAAAERIPIVLHEPNRRPGVVNRFFGRVASCVTVGDEAAASAFPRGRVRVTGVPVRRAVLEADRARGRRTLGIADGAFAVLVLGGSQGAGAINRAMTQALPGLGSMPEPLSIVWLSGRAGEAVLAPVAKAAPVPVRLFGYLDDMASALAAADLVVGRAGASTLAEIAATGRPAVLVPYPHAAADHQARNAEAAGQAGAALVIPERELTGTRLAEAIGALAGDPARLADMGRRSAELGRPDAARDVALAILEIMGIEARA
ncbi:MAG: undecaprenyldiphospho-muramoylpentapeptide beta-N-acetylglucosaminyltransferase [Candidatus Coatesbacteria bacterium]